jgi:site-specific recombinase XerD
MSFNKIIKVVNLDEPLVVTNKNPSGNVASILFDNPCPDPVKLYFEGLGKLTCYHNSLYLRKINKLLGYPEAHKVDWSKLRFQHVVLIRAHLVKEGKAPSTVNGYLVLLKGIARASWQLEMISADDYQRIKDVEVPKGSRELAGRALCSEEVSALYNICAEDSTPFGVRDAAILTVLVGGGLRRFECAGLDLSDYDPKAGSVKVIGKGNKERTVYLAAGSEAPMAAWLELRGMEPGPLFYPLTRSGRIKRKRMCNETIFCMLRLLARKAAVKKFSPHDLRRTFISDLLDAGADLPAVQRQAGHSNTSTTSRYDRRGERAQKKAAALLKLPYKSKPDKPSDPASPELLNET